MTEDLRLPADLALLKTFKIKAVIDFIKWTDEDGSTPGSVIRERFVDRANQLGKRWTLHDLRLPHLRKIPPEVLARPLEALELSIDFYPRDGGSLTEEALLQALGACQEMLSRRLAPWQAEGVGERIYRVEGAGDDLTGKKHLAKDIKVAVHPTLGNLFASGWHDASPPTLPRRTADGVWSTTLYYGHDPSAARAVSAGHSDEGSPEDSLTIAQAQVRLYIKTYDRGARIAKQKDWRTRMEVTFNRAALLAQGQSRIDLVGDLLRPCLRTLVNKYLKLTVAQVDQKALIEMRKRTGGRRDLGMMVKAIRADLVARAEQAAHRARDTGALLVGPADNIRYKTVAKLNRIIGRAVEQLYKGSKSSVSGPSKS